MQACFLELWGSLSTCKGIMCPHISLMYPSCIPHVPLTYPSRIPLMFQRNMSSCSGHLILLPVLLSIATSSSRELFNLKIATHRGPLFLVQEIAYGDEVATGKPRPDIYFAATRKPGLQPEECLALEDAPIGISYKVWHRPYIHTALQTSFVQVQQTNISSMNKLPENNYLEVLEFCSPPEAWWNHDGSTVWTQFKNHQHTKSREAIQLATLAQIRSCTSCYCTYQPLFAIFAALLSRQGRAGRVGKGREGTIICASGQCCRCSRNTA